MHFAHAHGGKETKQTRTTKCANGTATNAKFLFASTLLRFLLRLGHPSTKSSLSVSAMASNAKKPKTAQNGGAATSGSSSGGATAIHAELAKARTTAAKEFSFNESRLHKEFKRHHAGFLRQECKAVAYWMRRDQRVQDNWALIYAQSVAREQRLPLHVAFCAVDESKDLTRRHHDFMLKGLKEVEAECRELDIEFHLLTSSERDGPAKELADFCKDKDVGCVVTDQMPLRQDRKWLEEAEAALEKKLGKERFCFYLVRENYIIIFLPKCNDYRNSFPSQVDAHNVVPLWEASNKQEYAARTIRPKINKKLQEYLVEFPPVTKHPHRAQQSHRGKKIDWSEVEKKLKLDESVKPVVNFKPGERDISFILVSCCTVLSNWRRHIPHFPHFAITSPLPCSTFPLRTGTTLPPARSSRSQSPSRTSPPGTPWAAPARTPSPGPPRTRPGCT